MMENSSRQSTGWALLVHFLFTVPAFATVTRLEKNPGIFLYIEDGKTVAREWIDKNGRRQIKGSIPDGVILEKDARGRTRAEWTYFRQQRHGIAKVFFSKGRVQVRVYEKGMKSAEFEWEGKDPLLSQKISRIKSRFYAQPANKAAAASAGVTPATSRHVSASSQTAATSSMPSGASQPTDPSNGATSLSPVSNDNNSVFTGDSVETSAEGGLNSKDTASRNSAAEVSSEISSQASPTTMDRTPSRTSEGRAAELPRTLPQEKLADKKTPARLHTSGLSSPSTVSFPDGSTLGKSSTETKSGIRPSEDITAAPVSPMFVSLPQSPPFIGGRLFADVSTWYDVGNGDGFDTTTEVTARVDFSSSLISQGDWTSRFDGALDLSTKNGITVHQGLDRTLDWNLFRATLSAQTSTTRIDVGRQELVFGHGTLFRPVGWYDTREFGRVLYESKPVNALRVQQDIAGSVLLDAFGTYTDTGYGVSGGFRLGGRIGPTEAFFIAHHRAPETRRAFGISRRMNDLSQLALTTTTDLTLKVYTETSIDYEKATHGVGAAHLTGVDLPLDDTGRLSVVMEYEVLYRNGKLINTTQDLTEQWTSLLGVGVSRTPEGEGWITQTMLAFDINTSSMLFRSAFGYSFGPRLNLFLHGQYSHAFSGTSGYFHRPLDGLPWSGQERSVGASAVVSF